MGWDRWAGGPGGQAGVVAVPSFCYMRVGMGIGRKKKSDRGLIYLCLERFHGMPLCMPATFTPNKPFSLLRFMPALPLPPTTLHTYLPTSPYSLTLLISFSSLAWRGTASPAGNVGIPYRHLPIQHIAPLAPRTSCPARDRSPTRFALAHYLCARPRLRHFPVLFISLSTPSISLPATTAAFLPKRRRRRHCLLVYFFTPLQPSSLPLSLYAMHAVLVLCERVACCLFGVTNAACMPTSPYRAGLTLIFWNLQ